MKLIKKLYKSCLLAAVAYLPVNAQEKPGFGLDAQMPRWYVGGGLFGGSQTSSITQNNWSGGYLNALNADIMAVKQHGGFNIGFNATLGYFLGNNRNFGLGTGLQYIHQQYEIGVHHLFVEYQSIDGLGSVFRQRIRSKGEISEEIKQNAFGIPLMLMFKKQLNNKWGVNLDGGVIFNVATNAKYEVDDAKFDYEAIYKFDNNGTPIYDNSPIPDPNSWLITKAHYENTNPNGDVNAYFEGLYTQGYNVGLGIEPTSNKEGDVKNISVSTSWFIRPSVSYRIKPNLALHANIMYQQLKTVFEPRTDYMITDRRGSYESMSNGISSNTQGLINLGLGIRYYFGKERVKEPKKPTPPPPPAPEPKTVVKEEPEKQDPYKEMVKVTIKLQDEKYGKPVEGNIIIKQGLKTVYNGKADNSGISNFYLEPGNYTVGVTAKGYIPAEENLQLMTTEKGKSKVIELKQPKIEKGLVFKLKAINFETASDQLTSSSFDILDRMAELLLENPSMVVEVAGHTDNVGNPQSNLALSQKRAGAVSDYLLSKGVKTNQLKAVGYGQTKPIASNDTEEGRLQNRRVMFTVLEFNP